MGLLLIVGLLVVGLSVVELLVVRHAVVGHAVVEFAIVGLAVVGMLAALHVNLLVQSLLHTCPMPSVLICDMRPMPRHTSHAASCL